MLNIDEIVDRFSQALLSGSGAFFLGSGISAASGLPDWLGLMKTLVRPLGLVLTPEDNLPLMAQHCVNYDGGNRGPLFGRIRGLLTSPATRANPYHAALSRTNVRTLWTTNFDTLLERALATARLAVRANDPDLTSGTRDFDVELLKVHGCIDRSSPHEIVLTLEDYEDFVVQRPALAERLRHDLLHNSMLFVGYSYRDPDIGTILVEARRLAQGATREHFMIIPEETDPGARQRQELWLSDLRRVGIRAALIKTHDELALALNRIALASRGKSVFITGSHGGADADAAEIGRLLAEHRQIVLLDGQSTGIGRLAANAFGTRCIEKQLDLRERVRYFPNPYAFNPAFANDPAYLETLKQWRAGLMRAAHTVVVFDGGMGTRAEVDVAMSMDCFIVPAPKTPTGDVAQLLKDPRIANRLPAAYVAKAATLTAMPDDVVQCVLHTFGP